MTYKDFNADMKKTLNRWWKGLGLREQYEIYSSAGHHKQEAAKGGNELL